MSNKTIRIPSRAMAFWLCFFPSPQLRPSIVPPSVALLRPGIGIQSHKEKEKMDLNHSMAILI